MSELARSRPQFFSAWVRNPLQMGAIAPSGDQLAAAMAAQVADVSGTVIELGAGTGAVTAALLARGIHPQQLLVVERDQRLAAQLARLFPTLRIIHGDAARLEKATRPFAAGPVDAVVSSLPLLSLHPVTRTRALLQAFALMRPGGRFIQFTYGPRAPIPERTALAMGVRGVRVARILRNLPPAAVWVYRSTAATAADY
jgi:phosphatidylethanolamine/phosphatidyl-N-methylethanolamine N-methyltransferase